jgi:ATP:corrinoid adenosyltransferase
MSQISKKFIQSNAVGATKIRLENNAALRARNAADSADVSILLVDSSDKIQFSSVPQVSSDPSSANDLVRKSYVDANLEGLKPKAATRLATTANITLSGLQTIDGILTIAGDRILVKDQTLSENNGIYVAAVGAWSRSIDMDSLTPIDEINGAYTFVQQGTANAGKGFVVADVVVTIGVSPIVFVFFNSTGSVVGGDMITVTGANIVSVDLASVSGLESTNPGNAAGQLRVKLEASIPSLQIDGSNQLAAKFDNTTIESSASGLRIKDAGVSNAKIATGVDAAKISSGVVSNTEFDFLDGVTSSIQTQLNGKLTTSLTSGQIFVGSVGNLAVAQPLSGDATLVASGALTIANSAITTVKIAAAAVDKTKIAADVAGAGLGQNVDGSLEIKVATVSALEVVTDELKVRVDASTVKINASNNLESLKLNDEVITLSGTNITNQYVDLAFTAHSAASVQFFPAQGPKQVRGVDYTVSLTSGAGGVTRVTFIGELATGGAAELVATDVIMISYMYL